MTGRSDGVAQSLSEVVDRLAEGPVGPLRLSAAETHVVEVFTEAEPGGGLHILDVQWAAR
ncbi:MAG: hypothetical protein OEY41_04360 [Acidimicrobiia bacterium]|nr:hypothetical protein [Acidimicrobiia bacterium]MDH5289214.1 hypothetical protein [Acidimicrobiia bacterium]